MSFDERDHVQLGERPHIGGEGVAHCEGIRHPIFRFFI
jgi:hypothetical protein